jgi:hypothetical protein
MGHGCIGPALAVMQECLLNRMTNRVLLCVLCFSCRHDRCAVACASCAPHRDCAICDHPLLDGLDDLHVEAFFCLCCCGDQLLHIDITTDHCGDNTGTGDGEGKLSGAALPPCQSISIPGVRMRAHWLALARLERRGHCAPPRKHAAEVTA